MGVVYAAYDSELDRKVALKLLRSTGVEAERTRRRLQREAKVMARLNHPNVAAVYDVGEHGQKLFLAMEYAEGGSLRDWMRRRAEANQTAPGAGWAEVVRLLSAAGEGLAAAHEAGLVHRDFKPENVLLGKDGRCKVTDFGLAQEATSEAIDVDENASPERPSADATWMSRTGGLIGTPAYMAPEQLAGEPADARSDVYAFATVLHEALYGARPIAGDDVEGLRKAAAAEAFSPVPAVVPARLRRVLVRGLRARPDDRYPTMRAMLDELARAPGGRRRAVLGLAVAATLGVGMIAWTGARARSAPPPDPCAGSGEAFGDLWSERAASEVRAALAGAGQAGAPTFDVVDRELGAFRRGWIDAHRDICLATHERHDQSQALLDARMECLEHGRLAVKSLVRHLAVGDAKVIDVAVQAAQSLEPPGSCRVRRGGAAPPDDPALRARARAVSETLAETRPFEYLKPPDDVVPQIRAAAKEAAAIGDRRLEAQAFITLGTLEVVAGRLENGRQRIARVDRSGARGEGRRGARRRVDPDLVGGVAERAGRGRRSRRGGRAGGDRGDGR
jgi:tRNA A-37 threonylcarbamoyl transferase component Bud32